jgi:hypothetical protein
MSTCSVSRMRAPSPAVTRAASIVFAVAAAAVLAFTALVNSHDARHPVARPAPSTPAPESTIDVPGTVSQGPSAAQRRAWLRLLRGRWVRDVRNNYFLFRADGTGEWVAYGQRLWTGKATPRSARTFELFDTHGQGGAAYWRVRLLSGGRLFFAGTRQVYRKI